MKRPETAAYLAKALRSLKEARVVAAGGLPEAAGRAAYLAAYHAAQALIFDCTGRAAKTHRGVRSEFARLIRHEPAIDQAFLTFLARAYGLKEAADYAIGHDARVSGAEAERAIETATCFVEAMSRHLSTEDTHYALNNVYRLASQVIVELTALWNAERTHSAACFRANIRLSWYFKIFPVALRGSAATISSRRGSL